MVLESENLRTLEEGPRINGLTYPLGDPDDGSSFNHNLGYGGSLATKLHSIVHG